MSRSNVLVRRVSIDEDLSGLVTDINNSEWDDDNDIDPYSERSLKEYLEINDTVFCVAHSDGVFAGMASGRIECKPYGGTWLYIDEVDVVVEARRQGVGTAIMEWLLAYAKELKCNELWLGTELDNVPAQKLYEKINPTEVEDFKGYTYELE